MLLIVLLFNRLLSMSFFKLLRFNWLKCDSLSVSNNTFLENSSSSSSISYYSPWKLINNFNRFIWISTYSSFSSILLTISHINIYHTILILALLLLLPALLIIKLSISLSMFYPLDIWWLFTADPYLLCTFAPSNCFLPKYLYNYSYYYYLQRKWK